MLPEECALVFCYYVTVKITLNSFPLFFQLFSRSKCSRKMKNCRQHLLWKRSQLLAQSRRWTTAFGELGKYCFQKQFFLAKKKRHSAQLIVSLNHNKLYRRLQCRRKALELQSRWALEATLNAETYQKPATEPYSFPLTESKKILSLSQSQKPIWKSSKKTQQ